MSRSRRRTESILPRLLVTAIFVSVTTAAGADEAARAVELFEKHVRPALIEHCIRCHGPDKVQGGLRLDSREGWAEGGDSGPAVLPGKRESLLLKAISYQHIELEMPPRGKLPDRTIDAFRDWILAGAPDPRSAVTSDPEPDAPSVEQGRDFWSFRPVDRPDIPSVRQSDWPANAIDRFVLAKLEAEGITPVGPADPTTLLRRLFYDIIGLPPTPEQIDQFLSDDSPTAYADLVDRLLDSPRFGQRWGRHWLDVVRFAQSSGGGRTLLFPDAWRYRDYVIDAINQDVPYNKFLAEQLAGDLLDAPDSQERSRLLTATAYLLLGPTNYELQDKDVLEMDIIDEQLDTLGKSLMGMTIGCARCHDHKFDPIPAEDYYALAGIFKSTQSVIHSNVSTWNTVRMPLPSEDEQRHQALEKKAEVLKLQVNKARKRWIAAGGKAGENTKAVAVDRIRGIVADDTAAERIGQWVESTSVQGYVGDGYIHDENAGKGNKSVHFRIPIESAGIHEAFLAYTPASNRSERVPVHIRHGDGESTVHVNQKLKPPVDGSFISLGRFEFEPEVDARIAVSTEGSGDGVVIADAVVLVKVTGSEPIVSLLGQSDDTAVDPAVVEKHKKLLDTLTAALKEAEQAIPARPVLMAAADGSEPSDIHVAIRGMAHEKGDLVRRGFLQVAQWKPFPEIPDGQSGRLQLAQWITDRQHPLTARVMANRIWYWLMGRGIVPTVDNFGSMGRPPSHPKLLDYLASEFVEDDWSIKRLIRQIVLSRTYRLSSRPEASAVASDPQNQWLWRANRKRLRAEDIRDSMLTIAGALDGSHGGANMKEGTKIEYGYQFTSTRRSVYLPVFRNTLPQLFEVFDFADPNIQVGGEECQYRRLPSVANDEPPLCHRAVAIGCGPTLGRLRPAGPRDRPDSPRLPASPRPGPRGRRNRRRCGPGRRWRSE